MGRRARWSMSSSVSKVATTVVGEESRSWAMAADAPMPGVDPALEADDHDRVGSSRSPTGSPQLGSIR